MRTFSTFYLTLRFGIRNLVFYVEMYEGESEVGRGRDVSLIIKQIRPSRITIGTFSIKSNK